MYIAASVGRDLYPIHSSILFLCARLLTGYEPCARTLGRRSFVFDA